MVKKCAIFSLMILIAFVERSEGVTARSDNAPKPLSASYTFKYTVILPAQEVNGKSFKLWVPYPAETEVQKVNKIFWSSREGKEASLIFKVTQEKKFGNKMVYVTGKTIQKPLEISFEYEVKRLEARSGYKRGGEAHAKYFSPSLFKGPDKLVPLFPEIREIAANESKSFKNTSQKIRALYDYVVRSMSYDKTGEGWGRGDAIWACSNKRGNCTDFHSLFIALNRSEGIPARFEIGFPIPTDKSEGEISGYHCWAEAYAKDVGWIPVDTTEAKKTGKPDEYFGKLPPNRIEFSRGRDIVLNPPQRGDKLNYFIYPYAEIGLESKQLQSKFYFKKISDSL